MVRKTLRNVGAILLLLCLPGLIWAQDAKAKLQEEAARNHETAARNHETAARLASVTVAEDPAAADRAVLAARKAQAAADKAQEAADRAQEAANASGIVDDQALAVQAGHSANRAQEAANRAQEIANRARKGESVTSEARSPSGPSVTQPAEPTAEAVSLASVRSSDSSEVSGKTGSNSSAPRTSAPTLNLMTPAATLATPRGVTMVAGTSAPVTPAVSAVTQVDPPDFNEFLNARFDALVRARLGPKNNSNQNETPPISTNSTSLVDKSSVGDLLSFALTPSGTTTNTNDADPTSTSITVSAYAFKAFASGRDPLDPAFYSANRNWRKVSFTYGYDYTSGKEGDPQEKGNIYGFKILPYDKRDVTNPSNANDIKAISELLSSSGPAAASAVAKVKRELFNALVDKGKLNATILAKPEAERFDEFRASLAGDSIVKDLSDALGGEDQLIQLVDDIIAKSIDPEVKFTEEEQKAFNRIQSRPQVALTFLTKQRKGMRPNEYLGGATMDLGVLDRWNLTFNGSFNITDNKVGENSSGGSFATELMIPLNVVDSLSDQMPWRLSAAASGKWLTHQGPMYQGQVKLTIPIPRMPGFELPISVSFANRSDLLVGKESKVQGRMGFTFDLARLLTAFKNQLGTP
jgi:hypothetical protein